MESDNLDVTTIIPVNTATVRQAETMIGSCEACSPDNAEIPFEWVIDRVTGITEEAPYYRLEAPGRCPACNVEVHKDTLVELKLPVSPLA